MQPLDKLRNASRHEQPATLSLTEVRQLIEEFDKMEDTVNPDNVVRGMPWMGGQDAV